MSGLGRVSRRQLRQYIKAWAILVDGEAVTNERMTLTDGQILRVGDQECIARSQIVILLHKPRGYVSSDVDEGKHLSYRHLLQDCPYVNMVHVAGRLDRDTEWLLICTNDGHLTHQIIKPTKQTWKVYTVHARDPLSDEDLDQLRMGVLIDDSYQTKPAVVTRMSIDRIELTITEWKFHQIKKMLWAIGNEVIYLRRDRVGLYELGSLWLWDWNIVE